MYGQVTIFSPFGCTWDHWSTCVQPQAVIHGTKSRQLCRLNPRRVDSLVSHSRFGSNVFLEYICLVFSTLNALYFHKWTTSISIVKWFQRHRILCVHYFVLDSCQYHFANRYVWNFIKLPSVDVCMVRLDMPLNAISVCIPHEIKKKRPRSCP